MFGWGLSILGSAAPGRPGAMSGDALRAAVEHEFWRILAIVVIALGAHLTVRLVRLFVARFLRSRAASRAKVQTLTRFLSSALIFAVYFVALGFVLREMGVTLTTYLASATVIGLAVSFGSQGVVQDVISGITIISADLVDIGDMVDIAGQVGIVQGIGIRYTVLVNFHGAVVFIPNRNVANVINYPKGYIRAFVDVHLPAEEEARRAAAGTVRRIADAAHRQFSGIILLPPSVMEVGGGERGLPFVRVKFRIWPGQGAVVETLIRQAIITELKKIEPAYADWMVAVHYRAEPQDAKRRLPRPASAAAAREGGEGGGEEGARPASVRRWRKLRAG